MKAIVIIAEFNPFHNGHKYIIEKAKKESSADYCVVIMSGDFVQRGAPAITDKFTRTRMALLCGADMVLELPVYYSLGSAEYFAKGAISILDRLGCAESLYFGCENPDMALLCEVADILNDEPEAFKETLSKELKSGNSYAGARQQAVISCISPYSESIPKILSSPNSILAVEYIRALKKLKSEIKPVAVKRAGSDYFSTEICETASATAIRKYLEENTLTPSLEDKLRLMMPRKAVSELLASPLSIDCKDNLSRLMHYKLISEKENGFTGYLDISEDFSNKICSMLDEYSDFDSFCAKLKTRDIVYSRISRALLHILLDIRASNMLEYKSSGFSGYARVLGMKKEASPLAKRIKECGNIPLFTNLKDAAGLLSELEMRLLNETLTSSRIYNLLFEKESINEYRLRPIIL